MNFADDTATRTRTSDRSDQPGRAWVSAAVGVDLYLKDESTHPTGSLKHRLARSLFLYALCNGWLQEGTTVIESSSGSTAVSEAYFARLVGVPFVAVMPSRTSPAKIGLINRQGGRCHLVDDPTEIFAVSRQLAAECGGHHMDRFTHAERATDWRGNNNIAESIFDQMSMDVRELLVRRVGPSTGTNLWATFGLVAEMAAAGRAGSVVALLCDGGERYADTYDDDAWVAAQGWDLTGPLAAVRAFLTTGEWTDR